jgi:hypothetical protein
MGLDMYLEGRKYLTRNWKHPENDATEDGFRLREKILELGYWRKEPNLHGYIVQTFADGKDDCQDIELCVEDLEKIREAVRNRQLPDTSGFFFGTAADPNSESVEEREWALAFERETIEILDNAIAWVNGKDETAMRWVVYRASW